MDSFNINHGKEEHDLINIGDTSEVQIEETSSTISSSSTDSLIQLDVIRLGNPGKSSDAIINGSLSSSLLDVDGTELSLELEDFQTPKEEVGNSADGDDLEMIGIRYSSPPDAMVRTDVPDPFRIPSSIFSRPQSSTPMEWSVQSNESLFSIHMGTDSFSRDHAILLDKDLPNLPPLEEGTQSFASENTDLQDDLRNAASEQGDYGEKTTGGSPHPSTSQSYHSDCSPTSINSFAFPILTGKTTSMSVRHDKKHYFHGSKKPEWKESPRPERKESQKQGLTPCAAQRSWCSCFSCFHCG